MEKTQKTTSSGQEVRPFANLMMDTAFKISFGKESGGQNMIYLLEKLLPGKHITEIEYTDKEHPGLFLSEKKSIFDLECKAGDESFVVEMQVQKKSSFQDRVLYYSTFWLREQLMTPLEEIQALTTEKKKEIADYKLRPVYLVSIVNFKLKHQSAEALDEGLISRYSIRNENADENMTEALHFVFLELGRMTYGPKEDYKCKNPLERLAFLFKNGEELTHLPESFEKDKEISELLKSMEIMKYTDEQRRRYEAEIFATLEKNSELKAARDDGIEEGFERGVEKGVKQGIEQGVRTVAQNLKASDIPPETIARVTGLTLEQIEAL